MPDRYILKLSAEVLNFNETEDTHMSKLYTITLNGVTEEVYNKATDYIEKHALRLNYRPEVSTIDAEFPDDIDPAKSPELQEAYIRNVQQRL